ncbi:MAG: dTDP-4-dehydrorhamnose reductase [Bacteroidetes bacterium]|nr:dTDP-4-dehydrorhamnose reductase [Bacteroidota bacterium]MBT4729176.1 dTDP-4-dehydrorhamnose reductase [Bacteroidota bacterium]MBT4967674.1 dTDP-4-dehydrorhamnose reductase [Bacteroidota bacterium]MBT7039025.1 dTDP-4-dehydrorhamnose reductase [Bacteroidota bacterium]MBT7994496.1 dTDP-4-dehydrorhamnose reductase [Bacteroidota bacterium]
MSLILVTGSDGQLGRSIKVIANQYPNFDFIFTDVGQLDITNQDQINQFFHDKRPSYLINCAAYTAVDKAETEIELAKQLNVEACRMLANACKEYETTLIHISTDFVFDGQKNQPYIEEDATEPVSAYGKSKLAGEKTIVDKLDDFVIFRTAWLYSEYGHNFVKTIMNKGAELGKLKVVYDQIGTPTYALDLAKAICDVISIPCFSRGIFHFTNEGVISWYDFAKAIVEIADIECEIQPIPSVEFPTPAVRPKYSVLDKTSLKSTYSMQIPYWRDSLKKCIKNLKNIK